MALDRRYSTKAFTPVGRPLATTNSHNSHNHFLCTGQRGLNNNTPHRTGPRLPCAMESARAETEEPHRTGPRLPCAMESAPAVTEQPHRTGSRLPCIMKTVHAVTEEPHRTSSRLSCAMESAPAVTQESHRTGPRLPCTMETAPAVTEKPISIPSVSRYNDSTLVDTYIRTTQLGLSAGEKSSLYSR